MTDVLPSRCLSATDAPSLVCRPVEGRDELAVHHAIRRAVFVAEQGLFTGTDADAHDHSDGTVHVLGFVGTLPAGTVRLYPLGAGLWKGDRLAVLAGHRHAGIGAPLVRYAVATAGTLGGRRMTATVQVANVQFFRALGWREVGPAADHLGVPHQQMSIALR